jgi:hypothetical protein
VVALEREQKAPVPESKAQNLSENTIKHFGM